MSTLGCLYELAPLEKKNTFEKTGERKHGATLVLVEIPLKFALHVDGNLFDVTLLLV